MASIKHILFDMEFSAGRFKSEEAILKKTPYEPEVMILGTFNPNIPSTSNVLKRNHADFYYGRNYLWPAFDNLFIGKEIKLKGTRMPKRGNPKNELVPSLGKILSLCEKLRLSFADLIVEVLHEKSPNYHILSNGNICYDNQTFNLIQDDKKNQVSGLAQLEKLGQIRWNIDNIIEYVNQNSSLKAIYFTRKPTGIWKGKCDEIKKATGIEIVNLFTPSGQGKPVLNSMERLLHHWLHNDNTEFGKFDPEWLERYQVPVENFRIN